MTDETWPAILSRITNHQPVDLDDGAATVLPRPAAITPFDGFAGGQAEEPAPSSGLWDAHEPNTSYIGVRVTDRLPDAAALAVRLASAALERRVIPIILSAIGNCGLERFGFRVERLATENPAAQAAFEAELSRFWRLAIIIDAADVAMIG